MLSGGEKGPSEIAREIGYVNPTQISGLLRQLASEGVVSRTAGVKWQVTGGTQNEQAGDAGAAESEAPAGTFPG